jgi:hypothetical protein
MTACSLYSLQTHLIHAGQEEKEMEYIRREDNSA